MNRISMTVVSRHIGLGIALVCLVALLTLLFSFLGTIACAAVFGMMFAASKPLRKYGIFASLIFPAVILGFVYFDKISLTLRQSSLLSLVCFGTFWGTFLMTLVAPYIEGRGTNSTVELPASLANPHPSPSPDTCTETPAWCGNELQGTWSRQAATGEGPPCEGTIEIVRNQFTLRVLAGDGQVESISRGRVELDRLGPFKVVKLYSNLATAIGGETPELPTIWIYRVADQNLVVASNFEERADGRVPAVEIYYRLQKRNEA